jgi:CDP-diacylglycerol--glycerol-3-phosphate 3-phosphatidyltransferase
VPQTPPAAAPRTPHVPTPLQRRIPNILTIARVVIAIAFFAALSLNWPVTPSQCLWAMGLFIIAAVTDALDGYLARKWNATSQFGRIMDPFADKILVVGAFVILAGPGFLWKVDAPDGTVALTFLASGVPPWIAIVILARELLVTSLRAVLESQGRDFSATWSGKLKMIAQSIAIPLILLLLGILGPADVAPGTPARVIILSIAYATAFLTVLSGVPYVTRALRPTQA